MKSAAALLLVLLFIQIPLQGQSDGRVKRFKRAEFEAKEEALRDEFWNGKTCNEPALDLECMAALSFYPELNNTRIKFRYRKLNETMRIRPNFWFFLRKRKKRKYVLSINNNEDPDKGIVIKQLEFNVLTGIMGHELGHISDYSEKGACTLIGNGFGYVFSRKFRRKFERATDQRTIDKGLGAQLYIARNFLLKESNLPEKAKRELRVYYMSPNEILGKLP